MTDAEFSLHARARSQQRSIPPIVIAWLDEFGEEQPDCKKEAMIQFFSKESRRRMENEFGKRFVQENSKYLKAYCVRSPGDDQVITIGWRNCRLRRQ